MKKILIKKVASMLGLSYDTVMAKCKTRGILQYETDLEVYFIYEKDLDTLNIDLRKNRHLGKYPKKYKTKNDDDKK